MRYFFCESFVFFVSCVSHAFASVHCCLVVTCWERADLLTLVGDVYCILLLSYVVFWVTCGTWLYRFLIFASFLTFMQTKHICALIHIWIKSEVGALSPPVKYFTDRSKAVLLLWIICVFLCLVFLMLSHLIIVALWSPCSERTDLLALVGDVYCIFVTFPCGILGQVWYLIVSFPDLCRLSYFYITQKINLYFQACESFT